MLRSLISCAAITAATLTLAPVAHAASYDGYCYVRSAGTAAKTCLSGEYYAYTNGYKPAPRAPKGYRVAYFVHRPSRDLYSQVYNASTLTANFEPGADNHFGNGGQYAYSGNGQYNNGQYNNTQYGDVQPGAIRGDHVRGWRDDSGSWHEGQPSAVGWRDMRGNWHEGRVAAFGWQDDQGNWHDNGTSNGAY